MDNSQNSKDGGSPISEQSLSDLISDDTSSVTGDEDKSIKLKKRNRRGNKIRK